VNRDYVFASGIAAGFVGGTFNLINSSMFPDFLGKVDLGGPRMAIPGTVLYALAGVTGQYGVNILENWRIQYIFQNEKRWKEGKKKEEKTKELEGEEGDEYEKQFKFLERLETAVGKENFEGRKKMLRGEIEKINGMVKKVDDEIAALETTREKSQK
jgi:hypothetical protein